MLTKVRDIVLGLLFITCAALGVASWWTYKSNAKIRADLDAVTSALQVEQTLRSAESKSLSNRLKAAEAQRLRKEKVDAATSKALQANPDWSNDRVPDDVIDALRM